MKERVKAVERTPRSMISGGKEAGSGEEEVITTTTTTTITIFERCWRGRLGCAGNVAFVGCDRQAEIYVAVLIAFGNMLKQRPSFREQWWRKVKQ